MAGVRYRCTNLDEQPHLAPSVAFLYNRQPPPPDFDQASLLYSHKPHEKYYWAQNKPIENEGRVIHLGSGMECQVYLKHGTIDGKPITYLSKHWSVHSQMRGFYAEMGLYASSCFLRQLQGVIVPRIIGLYSAPGATVDVAMEPPHRVSWREADKHIADAVKQKIVDAYAAIHARGVLHGDVELRHMLVGDDGRITIIDFGLAAVTVDGFEELGLRRTSPAMLAVEMRRVRFLLDFPRGTRDAELALSRRYDQEVEQARHERRPCPEPYAPAIPLRVIEEQWMRSADEVGRRFAIPATVPIIDGRPRQRNALIVPANAASDEEVENLLPFNGIASPSSDGEDEDDAPAVKQEPDADKATVKKEPAEFTVKAEEDEDVKPVIDREEGSSGTSKKRRHESESEEPAAEPSPSKRARVATPPPLTKSACDRPSNIPDGVFDKPSAGPSRIPGGIFDNSSKLTPSALNAMSAAPRPAPAPMAPPPAPSTPRPPSNGATPHPASVPRPAANGAEPRPTANGAAPAADAPGAPEYVPRYGLDCPGVPLEMRVFTDAEVMESVRRQMQAGVPVWKGFRRMGPYWYAPCGRDTPPPMPTSPTAAPPPALPIPARATGKRTLRTGAPAPTAKDCAALRALHQLNSPAIDGGPHAIPLVAGLSEEELEAIVERAFGLKRERAEDLVPELRWMRPYAPLPGPAFETRPSGTKREREPEPEASATPENAHKRVRFDPAVQVHTRPMAGPQHLGIPPRMPGAGAGMGPGMGVANGAGGAAQQPRIVVRPPTSAAAPGPAGIDPRLLATYGAPVPRPQSPGASRH